MSTLELRSVTHRYAQSQADALRSVSLTVADGQMVSIIGPSGSGKSTLLRVAAGLLPSGVGKVKIAERDVTGLPTERRDITMMFQSPLLFDHLDVAGNIGFSPRLAGIGRREARRVAERYLRLVHLEGFDKRAVSSLSGGQQQRVALARALAAERGVLLLDEPFSSLDRELKTSMHELLEELRSALSPTIMLVTHDLDEAARAETTVVLIDGVVQQHAPMSEIYRRPHSVQVARLLGGFNEIRGSARDGMHHSRWGTIPVDGRVLDADESVMLLRRETLQLREIGDPGFGIDARVVGRRPAGMRIVATLFGEDESQLEVELSPGQDVQVGSVVRVGRSRDGVAPWAVNSQDPGAAKDALMPGRGGQY